MPAYDPYQEYKPQHKLMLFIEEIWPTIYKWVNAFFWGVIRFIGFIFSGLKPQ